MITTGSRVDVRVHFEILTDPRRGEPTYPLLNIVIMTLSAVISGADDFVAIAEFVSTKNDWFGTFFYIEGRSFA